MKWNKWARTSKYSTGRKSTWTRNNNGEQENANKERAMNIFRLMRRTFRPKSLEALNNGLLFPRLSFRYFHSYDILHVIARTPVGGLAMSLGGAESDTVR